MPLDPNISLGFQPPQLQNPLATIGQIQALKNQQLAAQGAQLDVQEKQRTLDQNQAVMQAFKDANGDVGQAIQNLNTRGYAQQGFTLQQHQAEVEKMVNDNKKTELDNIAHKADLIGRSAQGVLDTKDPDLRSMAYHNAKSYLVSNGLVKGDQLPDVYTPDLDPLLQTQVARSQSIKDAAETHKNQLEAGAAGTLTEQRKQETAAKQRTDALNTLSAAASPEDFQQKLTGLTGRVPDSVLQEFSGKQWTPEYAQQLQTQALTPEQRTTAPKTAAETEAAQVKNAALSLAQAASRSPAEYQQLLAQQPPAVQKRFAALGSSPRFNDVLQVGMTPGEARTASHEQFIEGQEATRTGLALKEFQQKFGDPLAGAAPADLLRYQSILNGDMPMPSPRSVGGQKTADAVLALAQQQGDTYSDSRYRTKTSFKNSKDADNLVSLATVMDHAQRGKANSADLGALPSLSLLTGKTLSPAAAKYQQDVEAMTGEMGKLMKNGVLTVDEHNKLSQALRSPVQSVRDAALDETLQLVGGKVGGLEQKYKTGTMGQDIPVDKYYSPETAGMLQRLGIGQAARQPAATPRTTPSAAVPAAVENVLKSVGPGMHTLSDGSKWRKAADGAVTRQ